MSFKDKLNAGVILAGLGLTKQDAINAALGMAVRRALLAGYREGEALPPFAVEASHIMKSLKYRRLLAGVGKKVRKKVFGKANVYDALMGIADEQSTALRTIRDRLEYDTGDIELDDEVMNAFVGDAVSWLTDRLNPSVSSDSHDQISSDEYPSLLIDLRSLGQHVSESEIFPDRKGDPLTPIDPEKPWLRIDA